MATPFTAETMRALHPDRLRFTLFSDRNPFMAAVGPSAELVRQNRCPSDPGNPLTALEHLASDCIEFWLKSWSNARNVLTEQVFLSTFGSPALQACMGLAADNAAPRGRIGRDLTREAVANAMRAEAEAAIERGGAIEALVRAVMYIARPGGRVDERGLAALQELSTMLPEEERPGFARFKVIVQQQFMALELDEERSIDVLPRLASSEADRRRVLDAPSHLLSLRPPLSSDQQARLERVTALLEPAVAKRSRRERASA
jgi:hypothetical protein